MISTTGDFMLQKLLCVCVTILVLLYYHLCLYFHVMLQEWHNVVCNFISRGIHYISHLLLS